MSPLPEMSERLGKILAAVEILSPSSFRIGGGPALDASTIAAMPSPVAARPAGEPPPPLRGPMTTAIYFAAYARDYGGGPVEPELFRHSVVHDPAFAATLAQANPSVSRWEAGWKVFLPATQGAVHVHKTDVALMVQPGNYTFLQGGGRPPSVGEYVEIFVPRDSLTIQPGNYFVFGETVASDYDSARMGRLYFNIPSREATWLLRTVAGKLNRYFIPFRLKCSVDPHHYDRADGFVLYVARRFMPVTLRLLAPLRAELDAKLQKGTPLFSKPLLDGLGAADDPGTGESFGQVCAALIVDALIDAWRAGQTSVEQRYEALAARFRTAGLSLARPHLTTGLNDIYDLPALGES